MTNENSSSGVQQMYTQWVWYKWKLNGQHAELLETCTAEVI